MPISCAEQMLGVGPLAERLGLAQAAGFDGIDLRWDTAVDAATPGTLAAEGLPVGAVYSQLRDPALLARTARQRADALDRLVERAEGAAKVGAANLIVVPIFGDPLVPAAAPLLETTELETALLLAALIELAERVAALPVTVVIEPLNAAETHFLTDPAVGAALCDAVGSPRIATMVDTYHCQREGQDPAEKVAAVGERLALVHLSDTDRGLPGEGSVDFPAVLRALRDRGYAGWLGFECRPPGYPAALRRSVDGLRALMDP